MDKKQVKGRNRQVEEKIHEVNQALVPKGKARGKAVGKQRRSHETSHEFH